MGLDITGLGSLFDFGSKVIDRVIPDKAQQDAAKLELVKLQQNGALAVMSAQTDINKVEAANTNIFVSGWRPAVGWICVLALAANYFVIPLLAWASSIYGIPQPPKLELSELMTLLFGMLGIGTLRTVEKAKGVAKAGG